MLAVAVAIAVGSAASVSATASAGAVSNSPSADMMASAAAPDPAQSVDLESIKVEATVVDMPASPKFTAPPVDISRSLTVVPKDVIEDTAASSLQEALLLVPGITFGAGEGGTPIADRPSIRGFNSTSNMFVDGMRDIGAQSRDIFAVEQVEVAKGPDSTLTGRGTGGGSINIVTKTPKADNFLNAGLRLGNADNVRVTADGNWRIADHAAIRLNLMSDQGGVPGRDEAVETERTGFAPSLTLGLGTATRATLDYYWLKDEGIPDYGVPNDPEIGLPVTELQDIDPENFYGLVDRDFRKQKTESATVTVEHSFANGLTLRSRTRSGHNSNSYVVTNPDDTAGNVPDGFVWRNAKSRWSENQSLASQLDLFGSFVTGSIRHSFDVGASFSTATQRLERWNVDSVGINERDCAAYPELFNTSDCTNLYDPDPSDPWQGTITRDHTPDEVHTIARAVYAFDSIEWNRHWETNVGLRWDSYNSKSKVPTEPALNANSKGDFLSYQLGMVYKPSDNGSVYLSTGTSTTPAALGSGDSDEATVDHETWRGFVPGNYNLEPEETRTLELGSKWMMFDRRLLVTAAVFEQNRKNANVEVAPGIYAQVGETRVRGLELSVSGHVTDDWQVFAGYSHLDGEVLTDDYNASTAGRPLRDTPEDALSLWTSYALTPDLRIGGGTFYRDKQISYLANPDRGSPDKYIPSWWRVDATAAYRFSPRFELQLNLQNVLDETYYQKSYYHYAIPAAGRTVLLSLDVKL